ncbi:hypothetical protein [Legionella feeleii]|nr:hypothetical protein [Legionella feeleii]
MVSTIQSVCIEITTWPIDVTESSYYPKSTLCLVCSLAATLALTDVASH